MLDSLLLALFFNVLNLALKTTSSSLDAVVFKECFLLLVMNYRNFCYFWFFFDRIAILCYVKIMTGFIVLFVTFGLIVWKSCIIVIRLFF